MRRIDIKNEEELESVFRISDQSTNPQVSKFRKFVKTLIAWNSPLEIWLTDDNVGFIAFTNGKKVNNLYDFGVMNSEKRKGIGTVLFDHYLDRSMGKSLRFRAHEDHEGYHFFLSRGYTPIEKDGKEYIFFVKSNENVKKYIKLFGSFGSGKTSVVRAITEKLTGLSCDEWEQSPTYSVLRSTTCKCGRYTVLGYWNKNNKCCGMDSISAIKDFNFVERIEKSIETIKGNVIFEEGMMTASKNIQDKLNKIFDFNTFFLDYSVDECLHRVIDIRGGKTTRKNIEQKVKGFTRTFDTIDTENKYKIDGTIEENCDKIIKMCNLKPCNCMVNYRKNNPLW